MSLSKPHPAAASWIWHPADSSPAATTRFLCFQHQFETTEASTPLRLLVSADQRFQLSVDGALVGQGPDRSDIEHWSLHTFERTLDAGSHRIEALVWHIAEDPAALVNGRAEQATPTVAPPMAQMSWRGGFYCEGAAGDLSLNTGKAPWTVCDLTHAVTLSRKGGLGYHDIGPSHHVDLRAWNSPGPSVPAAVVLGTEDPHLRLHGVVTPGWKFHSSGLPPQRTDTFQGGVIRTGDLNFPATLPPHSQHTLIWDTETYLCGYPALHWSGGQGSEISVEWAESLYLPPESGGVNASSPKGKRDEVEGKIWFGFGDSFTASGAAESSPAFWWRSGRYLRVQIQTRDCPITLERPAIRTTCYPLDAGDQWRGDPAWENILALCRKTLEAGAHETWADSPYYEQMMYVGDTRLHALSNYLCYRDERLTRRGIDLLNWSRQGSPQGLVAERYPSAWRQDSGTYAMMFFWMLRDFLYWRDDEDFVRGHLAAMRQLLESLLIFCEADGRMGAVPGWPFVDWAVGWHQGCGPGVREGDSSILSLHWVLTLQAAAQIERAVGEEVLATRCDRIAARCMEATLSRYWDPRRNLLLDTFDPSAPTSEHAQTLALLTQLAGPGRDAHMLHALESQSPGIRCTIYFRAYLLEALFLHRREAAFHRLLDEWRDMPRHGFKTLPEQPEPTRSDCHAWSAHPLYHSHASIAGIRSLAPGFQKISIRPLPGPFQEFESVCIHPKGEIRVKYSHGKLDVSIPPGVDYVP